MRLKNILLTAVDLEKSINFYHDLFGLQVIRRFEGNVILTEGLVLQDSNIWRDCLGKEILPHNNAAEIYFEEPDMDTFLEKLSTCNYDIIYVTPPVTLPWNQKIVRFYDPSGNLIEVRSV